MLASSVAAFVLAGGRSSRMGSDKATLEWDGMTLLDRAISVVQSVTEVVAIVGHPVKHRAGPLPVLSDRIIGAGPLGGIEAALNWSPCSWNLVVACDMPLLNTAILTAIVEQTATQFEYDAVIPLLDGRPEPLCAAYHVRALPAIQAALHAGTFKIMDALRFPSGFAALRIGHLEVTAGAAFRNVNSPEDWNKLMSEESE